MEAEIDKLAGSLDYTPAALRALMEKHGDLNKVRDELRASSKPGDWSSGEVGGEASEQEAEKEEEESKPASSEDGFFEDDLWDE